MLDSTAATDHHAPDGVVALLRTSGQPQGSAPAEDPSRRLFALECFGSLLESSHDAVALLDASGSLFYANTRFISLQAELSVPGFDARSRPLQLPALRGLRAGLEQGRRSGGDCAQRPAAACIDVSGATHKRRLKASARMISCAMQGGDVQEVTMLVLHDPDSESKERLRTFRAKYALTFTESRVLELFLDGKDLRAISLQLHMSIHTARAHMKALLAKTGCCRQPEMVCLLSGTPTSSFRMTL